MFRSNVSRVLSIALLAYVLSGTLGCTGSSPPTSSEYHQGAYRPAPPTFRPAHDAPHTVGQPGHVRPLTEYPRSPHKRPLPPTAEPTIYGGDEPKAAAGSGLDLDTGPVLYGVHLALPAKPLPFDASVKAARSCASRMKAAIARSGGAAYVSRMHIDPLKCFLASLYSSCFESLWALVAQAAVDSGRTKETVEEVVGKVMFHVAKAWEVQACIKAPLAKPDTHILIAADGNLQLIIRSGENP